MKIRQNINFLIALLMLSAAGTTFAQNVNPALNAYREWRAKNLTQEMSAEGNHIEMAFAVSRYENIGATINIVVGVGAKVNGLGEMQFIAQPMAVKKSPEGKVLFEEIEGAATLVFPELSDVEDREDDILASPQLTIKAPSNTEAVKIIVRESSTKLQYTITLALQNATTTAVLAGTVDSKMESLGKCFWYYSDCGGSCGRICIACNNKQPNINCPACTATCGDGGACTSSNPKPLNCSN